MKIDHATIVTPQLEAVRQFFCDIVGLTAGERPPFGFEGYWLYHDGKAVIHLIKTHSERPITKSPARIDHIAFRVDSADEWNKLITKLQAATYEYESSQVPATGERQLFVVPTPGVMIEFVTAAA
ncbi:extradiol dioxygenase [Herminiimonas sp. KBW02]|uniref:VOC family protein n=1 Tax=Herminiimonas sp. KBW02 TaxID=2153363 RepID=UPI000F5AEB06|nr:VOC family protein [Herminiimonas sp. KBW02]RQO33885.1 extradiol dioxygenase [Herminiimonas sp. KBW02]